MLGFLLGISITLNVITVIGLIIFLSVKNKAINKVDSCFNDFLNDEIVDSKIASDFINDSKIDLNKVSRWK